MYDQKKKKTKKRLKPRIFGDLVAYHSQYANGDMRIYNNHMDLYGWECPDIFTYLKMMVVDFHEYIEW